MAENGRPRVAIACQGGGSHTAFTAGVLKRLVSDDRREIVALSGTSGGAVCAYLAWYGLSRGDPEHAGRLLDTFWADMSASTPWDAALNSWLVGMSRLEGTVALPAVSPYLYPPWAEVRFRRELERLVPPSSLKEVAEGPLLLVGAVDVRSGEFRAFSSARGEVTADAILASAAVPSLFRAVRVGSGVYWDGLFSQNPPVRELPDAKPDAIWIVRINPARRAGEPMTTPDIIDRRNELAGNLSLSQELYFIEKINQLVRSGAFADTKYREIELRFIELDRDLDLASKVDRSPGFISQLMALGEQRADAFLAERN
jgi:NTE family protein